MSESNQLHVLQEVDQELSEKESALEKVERELGDREALDSARLELAAEQQKLAAAEKAQQSLEWDIQDLGQKVRQLEKKLYGGETTSSKELLAMQKDVDSLQARRRSLEDKLLDVMVEVETIQAEVKGRLSALEAQEKEWQRRQAELQRQQAELKVAIATLKDRRLEASRQVSAPTLGLYESVRSARGQAVARVERGMCQGCRLILPVNEWQRVRSGALVQCSSCGRILCLD